jgi:hemoglobin
MKSSLIAGAVTTLLGATLVAGCAAPAAPVAAVRDLQDGEVPLPAGYTAWPQFLTDVQRPDLKQVRAIYVNPTGFAAKPGQPLAYGTTYVMENYAAELDAAGQPRVGADGRLVKGRLLRVLVMSKGPGFGSAAPAEQKNGEWAYASYDAAGMKTADALAPCRTCHLPQAKNDFVFRLEEFHQVRSAGRY